MHLRGFHSHRVIQFSHTVYFVDSSRARRSFWVCLETSGGPTPTRVPEAAPVHLPAIRPARSIGFSLGVPVLAEADACPFRHSK